MEVCDEKTRYITANGWRLPSPLMKISYGQELDELAKVFVCNHFFFVTFFLPLQKSISISISITVSISMTKVNFYIYLKHFALNSAHIRA